MTVATIPFLPISELARGYRRGLFSPVEITRWLLDRLQRLDPRLKAFIRVTPERPLREAEKAERAFRTGFYSVLGIT